MPVDYNALMALDVPDVTQRYTARDTMLYALGIGFGADPLDERQLRFDGDEVRFRTRVVDRDVVAIGNGRARLR